MAGAKGLPDYSPDAVARKTGVAPKIITRLAREIAAAGSGVAIVGGAPLAQTNGLFTALAVNALNALLGSVGRPGGVFFSPGLPLGESKALPATAAEPRLISVRTFAERALFGARAGYDQGSPGQWSESCLCGTHRLARAGGAGQSPVHSELRQFPGRDEQPRRLDLA